MRRSVRKEKLFMGKYLNIGSSFIRRHYIPHLLLTFLFCCISGFFASFRNLDASQAAKVMEMYVAFTGIFLFTPLFMPEQNKEIWLLEKSKGMDLWKLYLIRILQAIVLLVIVITIFIQVMKQGNSQFSFEKLWLGSFCEIFFLGSIGFFVSGITNQVVLGYMISVIYFISNIGVSKYLGHFALFQMMKGSYNFVVPMSIAALILIIGGITLREKINQ